MEENSVRTEQEIKSELRKVKEKLITVHKAYQNRRIPFDLAEIEINKCHTIIQTLQWVLKQKENIKHK